MIYNFTVSPDFNPSYLSGWFIFNTWLQRQIGEAIHLDLYDDFDCQRQAIAEDKFDLIYANPYDASVLVREQGFVPIVCPAGKSDEAMIVVAADNEVDEVEGLSAGLRITATKDPDVNMMCMIMLEPADLNRENTITQHRDSYVLLAKDIIRGEADVGFFLEETYNKLSRIVKSQLKLLVQSQIQVINHVLSLGPALQHRQAEIQQALLDMNTTVAGQSLLESLSFTAWAKVEPEDTEFMIDLMDTLET